MEWGRLASVGIAALLALAGLALWWTRTRHGRRASGETGRAQTGEAAAARRRIDVATGARGAIEGTVRDRAGAPVAAAQVWGSAFSKELSNEDQRDPVCAATSEDGHYRLANLLPASYTVDGTAPHFAPGRYRDANRRTSFPLAAGEERRGVDIVLQPGGFVLAGVVRDIGGGPIEGAWIRARPVPGDSDAVAGTRSLAGGSFHLWVESDYRQVVASADGYADGETMTSGPDEAVEILLTAESILSGRVVEVGTGAPVPGAQVMTSFGYDHVGADMGEGPSLARTVADDQGRFRFSRLRPGRYKPVATSPRGFGQARESVLLDIGQSAEAVIVELHPGVPARGRVLVVGDRASCPTGSVALFDRKRERHWTGSIEEGGRVEFIGLLPGVYRVAVRCDRYLSEPGYPDVVVDDTSPSEQCWTVYPGAWIRGTVRTYGGPPAGGALIQAAQLVAGGRSHGIGSQTRSDADGTFELGPLRGGHYELEVRPADEPPTARPVAVTLAEGGEATIDIRLDEDGTVAGEVVNDQGQPVVGVTVNAVSMRDAGATAALSMGAARTRSDGSFAVRGLRPGSYRVFVESLGSPSGALRAPGQSDQDEIGEKVTVVAGVTTRLQLVVENQDRVISGRVADGHGQPISAYVDAEREPDLPAAQARETRRRVRCNLLRRSVLSDADGNFAINGLTQGKYTVRAYRRGGGEALADGVPVGASVTLTIRETVSISGCVRSDRGVPEEITVAITDEQTGFSRRERFFRTRGAFAMRDLPPGSFHVSVGAAEGIGDIQANLADGQDLTDIAIRLATHSIVTGRLLSRDDGVPLPGFMVHIRSLERTIELPSGMTPDDEPVQTDAEGRFSVEGPMQGRVLIRAAPFRSTVAGYAWVERVALLERGRTTDIGDVHVPRTRVVPGEPGGDLGFQVKWPPGGSEEEATMVVDGIRPDGPASKSGLQVGDTIVSVDGNDVRGDRSLYLALSKVPPGTTVTFGLARGANALVTAAAR